MLIEKELDILQLILLTGKQNHFKIFTMQYPLLVFFCQSSLVSQCKFNIQLSFNTYWISLLKRQPFISNLKQLWMYNIIIHKFINLKALLQVFRKESRSLIESSSLELERLSWVNIYKFPMIRIRYIVESHIGVTKKFQNYLVVKSVTIRSVLTIVVQSF